VDESPITSEDVTKKKRKHAILGLTVLFVSLALVYAIYWLLVARFYEETDNAYVNGNIVPITAQVAGTVIAVKADNTQYVITDALLVQLDPIDTYLAFEQAKARLAETIRTTEQLYINNTSLEATIQEREIARNKASNDLARRKTAIGAGAVSHEELNHAEETLKSADAALIQARAALFSNRVLTENTELKKHPNVLAAAATLRQAYIDYKRTAIRAPTNGEISKRTAQVGQRVSAGTQLMALVPLNEMWVDANFKEKQLRFMRAGQPATLTSDLYGSSVTYHGKIVGFSAGTGSAFALLPAQNATGNWIKVVQRLPVRIVIDPQELKEHPLRLGLSMTAEVDLHKKEGKPLLETAPLTDFKTTIYENLGKDADAEVNQVIEENITRTALLNSANADDRRQMQRKKA
jgi:membrane fusion protein (multidrug efflux system)